MVPESEQGCNGFGGKFKITSGDARGLALTMLGNGEDAKIYTGKSLMQTLRVR